MTHGLFFNLNLLHLILLLFYTNRMNLFFFLINLQYHHRIYQHGQIHNVFAVSPVEAETKSMHPHIVYPIKSTPSSLTAASIALI